MSAVPESAAGRLAKPTTQFRIEERAKAVVVQVVGVVDLASAPVLRRDLDRAARLAHGAGSAVIVSLEQCQYLDSTAFKALAAFQREWGDLLHVVVPPPHRVRALFDLLGYADQFAFAPSLEAATAAL